MPFERMERVASALAPIIADYMKEKALVAGKDIAFLVSSDGNHYGRDFDNVPFGEGLPAWEKATALDRRLITDYLTGPLDAARIEGLTRSSGERPISTTGTPIGAASIPVPFGLLAAGKIVALSTGRGLSGRSSAIRTPTARASCRSRDGDGDDGALLPAPLGQLLLDRLLLD